MASPPFGWDAAAAVRAWLPERRAFAVNSATGGRFTLHEQFYPGWSAAIDGRPRGVLTKYGISRVRFRDMAHRGELPGITKSSW